MHYLFVNSLPLLFLRQPKLDTREQFFALNTTQTYSKQLSSLKPKKPNRIFDSIGFFNSIGIKELLQECHLNDAIGIRPCDNQNVNINLNTKRVCYCLALI